MVPPLQNSAGQLGNVEGIFFRFLDEFRSLGHFFRPHFCHRRFLVGNLGKNVKQIKKEIPVEVAKMLYLDLVERPTRSITCCELPTRVLTLASNGLTLMEPSAGAGGNVARQVVDVDIDGCQRRIVPRAPID
jgi:hypothetical protein